MKIGVSHITDEALEELNRLGVIAKREEHSWSIFTDPYDLYYTDFIERHITGIEAEYMPAPQDRKEYRAQGLRIWKSPDSGRYYYLIKDRVFYMEQRIKKDYSATEVTQFVVTLFDLVDEYDQDHFRDILMKQQPMAETGRFL